MDNAHEKSCLLNLKLTAASTHENKWDQTIFEPVLLSTNLNILPVRRPAVVRPYRSFYVAFSAQRAQILLHGFYTPFLRDKPRLGQ